MRPAPLVHARSPAHCGSRTARAPAARPTPRTSSASGRSDGDVPRGVGNPQDQARHRHHAGEPLLRQLLRHLSRGPTASPCQRRAHGVRARSRHGGCVAPYHDTADINGGGPHGAANASADIERRARWTASSRRRETGQQGLRATSTTRPAADSGRRPTSWATTTRGEIPNYWTYAKDFVLEDHMFEPVQVLEPARPPVHGLGLVGAVHATRSPTSCVNNIVGPCRHAQLQLAVDQACAPARRRSTTPGPTSPSCSTTQNVSWAYYLETATSPTARTTRDDLRASGPEATRRRGSGTRCRSSTTCSRTTSSATSSRSRTSSPRPQTARCRR